MKKGFLTLIVALLTLVGTLGYGAVPEMLTIPDVVIGDFEDEATTPNFFVWNNAFNFDDYWIVPTATTGTWTGIQFIYDLATVPNVIAINDKKDTDKFNVYSLNAHKASFRNLLCSPYVGPQTAHPVGTSTPIVVDLAVRNAYKAVAHKHGSFTVYTIDGAKDRFIGEYYKNEVTSTSFSSLPTPPWYFFTANVPVSPDLPTGLSTLLGFYSSTDSAIVLDTVNKENSFGYWTDNRATTDVRVQTLIPYVDEGAYIIRANLFAKPRVSTTALDLTPPAADFVPWIRLRVNSANESVYQEMDILSTNNGSLEVTTDPTKATTETMIMDPRNQNLAGSAYVGLNKLYFSFDLIDFPSLNGRNEEGLVGLRALDVQTFPMSGITSIRSQKTLVKTYPVAATFQAEQSFYTKFTTGFGSSAPTIDFNPSGGFMRITDSNIARGFAYFQLSSEGMAVSADLAKWYLYKFYLTRSGSAGGNDPEQLRLRLLYGDEQRHINYGVKQTGDRNAYQFNVIPPDSTLVYNVFMVPKAGELYKLFWAFDYIDFSTSHGSVVLELQKVEVYTLAPAQFKV